MIRTNAWPRPNFRPCEVSASIEFFCLADDELEPEGYPHKYWDWYPYDEALPEWLNVGSATREAVPDAFAWFEQGPVRPDGPLAVSTLSDLRQRLPRARYAYRIAADLADPPDLGYLQAAWSTVRWFVDAGAYAVLDTSAIRWHSREEILGRAGIERFSLRREACTMFVQLDSNENDYVVAVRGMNKFARPNLVYVMEGMSASQVEYGKYLCEGIATQMALGALFDEDEDPRYEGTRFRLEAYDPGVNAPDLELDGPTAVIVVAPNGTDSR